jgi:hypothetical protein
METNMRKAVLTVLGMALIGALTIQTAAGRASQPEAHARDCSGNAATSRASPALHACAHLRASRHSHQKL